MAGDEQDRLTASLRQLLIQARKTKGMNQTQLGQAMGRTQSFVSNYERGERKVGVIDLILIARILGEDPRELFARLLQNK